MAQTIQIKRGNNENFSSVQLKEGELAFVKDTKKLYVGDGITNVLINPDNNVDVPVKSVNGKTGAVVINKEDVGLSKVENLSKTEILQGNSSTATKLQTPRTITLSGNATGSTSFDGSQNVTLTVTISGIDGGTF